ncbi:hypothetical protein T484DRAFT_1822201 [Baffinella frigidus]|nr:hypothetical protein T484DRAFT_1822201 [Cryptophyta sp. CCMP2293]
MQIAVLELLSALCTGSSPNPQLCASSFLSIADVMRNVTRLHLYASSFLSIADVVRNVTRLHVCEASVTNNAPTDLPHSAFKGNP